MLVLDLVAGQRSLRAVRPLGWNRPPGRSRSCTSARGTALRASRELAPDRTRRNSTPKNITNIRYTKIITRLYHCMHDCCFHTNLFVKCNPRREVSALSSRDVAVWWRKFLKRKPFSTNARLRLTDEHGHVIADVEVVRLVVLCFSKLNCKRKSFPKLHIMIKLGLKITNTNFQYHLRKE